MVSIIDFYVLQKRPSKEGFDIVIGNPPYVNFANIKSAEYRTVLKEKFYSTKNKCDLYAFFIEFGFDILNRNGIITYIVPHTWKATDSFSKLREIASIMAKFFIEISSNILTYHFLTCSTISSAASAVLATIKIESSSARQLKICSENASIN